MNTEDLEIYLKVIRDKEYWLQEDLGIIFQMDVVNKQLMGVIRVQEVWSKDKFEHFLNNLYSLGFKAFITSETTWVNKDQFDRCFRKVKERARIENKAVVDYATEILKQIYQTSMLKAI